MSRRNRKSRNEEIRKKKYDPATWSRLEVKEIAYHDGTRYYCTNIFCHAEKATLREIGRMSSYNGMSYTPVLQCTKCKAYYYGLDTRDLDAIEVIKQHAERVKRTEEERIQNAITLAEMDAEEFYQEEERREKAIREEAEAEYEAYISAKNGDIILPNIIGEPQRKQTRPDDDDTDGDIILPNTITI